MTQITEDNWKQTLDADHGQAAQKYLDYLDDPHLSMPIGDRVHRHRKALQESVDEFCEKMGWSERKYHKFEEGQIDPYGWKAIQFIDLQSMTDVGTCYKYVAFVETSINWVAIKLIDNLYVLKRFVSGTSQYASKLTKGQEALFAKVSPTDMPQSLAKALSKYQRGQQYKSGKRLGYQRSEIERMAIRLLTRQHFRQWNK